MNGLAEYLSMEGDGRFIWSAYAVALLVLIGLVVVSVRNYRLRQTELNVLRELDGDNRYSDDGERR